MEVREPTGPELAQVPDPQGTLPPEWLAWADEPHRVLVAVQAGTVAGAVHVAVVGRGEGWVEGVRGQDPEVEARLVAAALKVLDGYGVSSVRTALPAAVRPAWLERAGFTETARFWVRVAPPDYAGPGAARAADRQEAGAVSAWLHRELQARQRALVALGWRWRAYLPEMALAAAREGRLLVDGAGGAAMVLRRGPDRLVAALVAGSPLGILGWVRAAMPEEGRLACFLAAGVPELEALSGWPAHPWCPEGVVVYQRPGGAA